MTFPELLRRLNNSDLNVLADWIDDRGEDKFELQINECEEFYKDRLKRIIRYYQCFTGIIIVGQKERTRIPLKVAEKFLLEQKDFLNTNDFVNIQYRNVCCFISSKFNWPLIGKTNDLS